YQQRHVAADIMENVGLLQVVELVTTTDEASRWEAAAREKSKENIVGYEAGHRDDPPSGGSIEHVAELPEIRDSACSDAERTQPVEELGTGPDDEELLVAFEKQPPNCVLLLAVGVPSLLDREPRSRPAAYLGH